MQSLALVTCVHQQAKLRVPQAVSQKHGFVSTDQIALQEFLVKKWRFALCFDTDVALIACGKNVVLLRKLRLGKLKTFLLCVLSNYELLAFKQSTPDSTNPITRSNVN